MKTAMLVEFYKLHNRSNIWIIGALLGGQILWSAMALAYMDEEDMRQGWSYFLFLFQLLDSLMMPLMVTVVMSRLCDIEHKGHSFRLINTLLPARKLFNAKFLLGLSYLVLVALCQVLVILCIGILFRFSGSPPWQLLAKYFVVTTVVNLTLLTIQLAFSLFYGNQMPAFIVGVIGSFFGLFSLYFPVSIQRLAPWGYYGVLMFLHMDWNPDTRISRYYQTPIDPVWMLVLVLMLVVSFFFGRYRFIGKEH